MSKTPSSVIRNSVELAGLGAERAAASMAALVDRELRAREPAVLEGGSGTKASTGVLFEMEGALSGVVALLLSAPACAEVVEALGADTSAAVSQSALREFGNILASQAVSAMADRLGARITLSVPTLVNDEASRVIDRLLARRGAAAVVETVLAASEGDPDAVLVFAPDAPS